MTRLGAVDLSQLPLPDALQIIQFSDIVAELKSRLLLRFPDAEDVIDDELEPLVYLTRNFGAREMQLRLGWNDKVRAVLLPTSTGADLDNVGVAYDVARMLVQEADLEASPARPRIMEDDTRFRRRIQLAPEAFATTGSYEAYLFHTLSADIRVLDAGIYNHASYFVHPGQVRVAVLPIAGADVVEVTNAVRARLLRKDIKPLTDDVTVQAAETLPLNVQAVLYTKVGPGAESVRLAALARLEAYLVTRRRVGSIISYSGIMRALHAPGVETATVLSPVTDVDPGLLGVYVPSTLDISVQVLNV